MEGQGKVPTVIEFVLTEDETLTFQNYAEASMTLDGTFKVAFDHHAKEKLKLERKKNEFWGELVKRAGFDDTRDMHYHGYEAAADFRGEAYVIRIYEKNPWDSEDWPKQKKEN